MTFQRGARAPGDDGHVGGVAQADEAGGFLGGFDEGHGVRQVWRLGVLAVRVVVAQGGVGGDAIAEEGLRLFDDGLGSLRHASSSCEGAL